MNVLREYLERKWDEEGIVPAWHQIADDLEDKVPLEVLEDIDKEVNRLMEYIIRAEGVVEYEGPPKRRVLNETGDRRNAKSTTCIIA